MPNQWFIESGGQTQGPLTDQQLKRLADGKQVMPHTRLRLGPNGQWATAASVKGLFPTTSVTAPDADDFGFDTLISEAIHKTDDAQSPPPRPTKAESVTTTFKPRDIPAKEFEELRRERGILRGLSFFFTFLIAPIAILGSIAMFVVAGLLSSEKRTEPQALQLALLAVSTLGSGLLALIGAVATRLVCGTVDLGLYMTALLEDIRQHTREH